MTREEANKLIMQACERTWNEKTCKEIFEALSQEPTVQDKQAESEKYQKAFDDGYANGYEQARFDYAQEPCDDAISRSGAIKAIEERAKRIKNEDTLNGLAGAVAILFELPPVNPTSNVSIQITEREKYGRFN